MSIPIPRPESYSHVVPCDSIQRDEWMKMMMMIMCQVKIGKLVFHIADDGPLVVPPPVDLDLDLYLGFGSGGFWVTTWVTSGSEVVKFLNICRFCSVTSCICLDILFSKMYHVQFSEVNTAGVCNKSMFFLVRENSDIFFFGLVECHHVVILFMEEIRLTTWDV